MTSARLLLAVGLVLLLQNTKGAAQVQVNGQLYSDLYALENASESRQLDYYQGLLLRVRPAGYRNLQLRTNLRVVRRGDPSEWSERVYSTYADWAAPEGAVQARLGRQFLYHGVVNGTLDGLSLALRPTKTTELRLVGGVAAPYDRSLDLNDWKDGGTVGAYAAARVIPEARVEASYIQRQRSDQLAWQQVGAAVSGTVASRVLYLAQLEYNLLASAWQAMRYRATYGPDSWSLFAEYGMQKPRIFEDSYFNIFKLVGFQQLRGGASVALGSYRVGLEGFHTIYDESETTDELMASLGSSWGVIGLVVQTGYGGENLGLYADVRYPVNEILTVRLHSSRYSYERRSIALNEEATSFSGGFEVKPTKDLALLAEVQNSMNTVYSNDWRGLVRATYAFRTRPVMRSTSR